MNKIKKSLLAASVLVGTCVAPMAALQSLGQELTDAEGNKVMDVKIRNRGNVHQILIDAALTVKGSSGTVTLTGNEQLPGIDSINVLARKTITKTIPWPEGLPFTEGGSYTGSLEYSE